MEHVELLNFVDVFIACEQFVEDPENEEKMQKVEEIKNKLIVRNYLSYRQKQAIVHLIIKEAFEENEPIVDFGIILDAYLILDGLLAYTNIDLKFDPAFKIIEVCDTLEYAGIIGYIYDSCKDDYNRLKDIVKQTVSWCNVQELIGIMENVDVESVDSLIHTIESFSSDKNVKILERLEKVLAYNDSGLAEIRDTIEKNAADIAMGREESQQTETKEE